MKYWDKYVCLSAACISEKPNRQTSLNFLCMSPGLCSVLLWQRCDALSTSCCMDDIMCLHNGHCDVLCIPKWREDSIAAKMLHQFQLNFAEWQRPSILIVS